MRARRRSNDGRALSLGEAAFLGARPQAVGCFQQIRLDEDAAETAEHWPPCRKSEPMESTLNMKASGARATRSSCSSWASAPSSSSGRRRSAKGWPAKGFRVVRFDNRDIGKSTHLAGQPAPDPRALFAEVMAGRRPHVPYTLDDMADDAVGLMDALGVERAHIVGASMGGMIAQLVAINHPDRTKSLISIMSTTGRRDLPSGNPETLSVLFRPPNSTSRDDLIDASILVQKALSGPGFPVKRSGDAREGRAPHGLRAFRHGRRRASVGGFDRRPAAQRALESSCVVPRSCCTARTIR